MSIITKIRVYDFIFLVKHIKSVDGFMGCYVGLAPKLCGNIMSAVVTQKLYENLDVIDDEDSDEELTEDQK